MNCLKCGKKLAEAKCRSCGYDICSQGFSSAFALTTSTLLKVNELLTTKMNSVLMGDGSNNPIYMDEEGSIHCTDTINSVGNGTKISEGTFAAIRPVRIPSDYLNPLE